MANFLSGISVGAHQGLANLVANKRAERAAKRDQRRYEGELMLRLGQIKSDRDDRKEALAYRKSRDEAEDRKWFESHGLAVDTLEATKAHRADTLAETVRTNKAAEEDRDLDRAQDQAQHEADLAERVRSRTDRNEIARLGILEDSRQAREALTQRKQEAIDTAMDRNVGRQLQREQQRTQADYYDDIIRLREQELNQTQDPLERAKIKAEIERIKAQTGYYQAQTANVGKSDAGGITFPQSRSATSDFAKTFGESFLERFIGGKQGKAWTVPFVQRQVGEGEFAGRFNLDWPGRMDVPLPWENPGDPSADTQQKRLRSIGSEAFQGLLREMDGDINATLNRMPTFFAELLDDPQRRNLFMDYLMFTPLNNPDTGQPYTEIEMLRLAKEELMKGARAAPGEMLFRSQKAGTAGTDKDHILDMDDPAQKTVPEKKSSFWDIF